MLRICLIATCGLLLAPSALAKDFGPGDLRVCGRHHCGPITNRHLLGIMSRYYYGPGRVSRAERVRLGAPGFELRYKNGYASGIVATAKLDRFRAYGFYCGRFQRGRWYHFPAGTAAALRRMTAGMHPLRVGPPPHSC